MKNITENKAVLTVVLVCVIILFAGTTLFVRKNHVKTFVFTGKSSHWSAEYVCKGNSENKMHKSSHETAEETLKICYNTNSEIRNVDISLEYPLGKSEFKRDSLDFSKFRCVKFHTYDRFSNNFIEDNLNNQKDLILIIKWNGLMKERIILKRSR